MVAELTMPRARSESPLAPKPQNAPVFCVPAPMRKRWLPLTPPSACVRGWKRYQPGSDTWLDAGVVESSIQPAPLAVVPRVTFSGEVGSALKFCAYVDPAVSYEMAAVA